MSVHHRTSCNEPGCTASVETNDVNLPEGWWRFQVNVSVPMWGSPVGSIGEGSLRHACPAHHSTVAMRIMVDLENTLAEAVAERRERFA